MTEPPAKRRNSRSRKYAFKRAAVACEQCRRSKTRCNYLNNGRTCFRCANLGLACSLQSTDLGQSAFSSSTMSARQNGVSGASEDPQVSPSLSRKIDEIHRGVVALLNRGRRGTGTGSPASIPAPLLPPSYLRNVLQDYVSPGSSPMYDSSEGVSPTNVGEVSVSLPPVLPPAPQAPPAPPPTTTAAPLLDRLYFDVTPFRDVRAMASYFGLPFSKELAYGLDATQGDGQVPEHDIVALGIVSEPLAVDLVALFQHNAAHWASISTAIPPKDLLQQLRLESTLLLAVCCLIGLVHCKEPLPSIDTADTAGTALRILHEIKALLAQTVHQVPQGKQTLQAMVLLATFSLTLSYKDVYLDGWFVSGYGLLHFITKEMDSNFLSQRFRTHPEHINNFRLWNHLALAHITFCTFSGRPCLIDTLRIDQCREILDIPVATSFDGMVVSQLSMILALYNCLQFQEPVENSLKELESTYAGWKYLCTQKPLGQFTQMSYHFARMMIYRRAFLQKFAHSKGFMDHAPLERDSLAQLKLASALPLARSLINECLEVINLAYACDQAELARSADSIKFSLFFSTLTMINLLRVGYGADDRQTQIDASIDRVKEICVHLNARCSYFNRFVDSYYVLLSKFSADSRKM